MSELLEQDVPLSQGRSVASLRAQAHKCRRLALSVDSETAARLEGLGLDLDDEANRAELL